MREIKFRAWDGKYMETEDYAMGVWIGTPKDKPKNIILMQYTGLKDKDGKEIYEGDIVEYEDICSNDYILQTGEKERGIITWIERRCQLMPQNIVENHHGGHYIAHWEFLTSKEIIGNIYENPDLLSDNTKE